MVIAKDRTSIIRRQFGTATGSRPPARVVGMTTGVFRSRNEARAVLVREADMPGGFADVPIDVVAGTELNAGDFDLAAAHAGFNSGSSLPALSKA